MEYFKAKTQFHQGMQCKDDKSFGQMIARLKKAEDLIKAFIKVIWIFFRFFFSLLKYRIGQNINHLRPMWSANGKRLKRKTTLFITIQFQNSPSWIQSNRRLLPKFIHTKNIIYSWAVRQTIFLNVLFLCKVHRKIYHPPTFFSKNRSYLFRPFGHFKTIFLSFVHIIW